MVALDAGHSEIASMLYSRMNIKCSVSLSPSRAGGGRPPRGDGVQACAKDCIVSCLLNLHGAPGRRNSGTRAETAWSHLASQSLNL